MEKKYEFPSNKLVMKFTTPKTQNITNLISVPTIIECGVGFKLFSNLEFLKKVEP